MKVQKQINVSHHVTDKGEAVETRSAPSRVISYIPYGEIFVEQQSVGWQSPYLFNSKELDSETGLYYYGARYLDPSEAMWLSVDPLFEKYVGMSPYGYCAGNPVGLVDPDGEATYLVVETKGTGHTFILVATENKIIVYTYGRYAEGGVMGGQGVLLKLENEVAEKYMKTELYRMEANAYIVSDANDSQICHFFDSQFNSSTELPQSGKHDIDTYGKVVDKYYLFGNNCTTKSCNAIKSSGSKIFDDQGILGYDEDFVIPSSLKDFLQENTINCTNDLKKVFENSPTKSPLKSAGSSGESSGSSGSSIGSYANSSIIDTSSSGNGSGSSSSSGGQDL